MIAGRGHLRTALLLITLGLTALTLSGCITFVSSSLSTFRLKPGEVAKVKILARTLNVSGPREFALIVLGIPPDGSLRPGKPLLDETGKAGGPYRMVRDDDVAAYLTENEACLPFYLLEELYRLRVYRTKQPLPRRVKLRTFPTTQRFTQRKLVEAGIGGYFPLYVSVGNMIEDGDGVFDPDAIGSGDEAACAGGSATWIRMKPVPDKARLDLPYSVGDALDSLGL